MVMRRVVFLAGGVLLAGAGVFMHSGGGPGAAPAASIQGPALEPAGSATIEAPTPPPPAPKPAVLDLDKMTLDGDHYVAPLGDQQVQLTIDPDLQKLAEKLLDESRAPRGAIVAMTPDGKILA